MVVERVLVTGASSGIGRATAHALAATGTGLWLLSRSPEALAEAAAECEARGAAEVQVLPVDVGDASAVERAVQTCRPDAVVHAAAVASYGEVVDTPSELLAALVRTNVLGTLVVSRAALRAFEAAGRGRLVLIGSVLGHVPVPYLGAYAASKAAVAMVGDVLRIETRALPDVHVTVVEPGAVDTPLYHQAATVLGREGRPPPPVVAPERVAAAVLDVLAASTPPPRVWVGPVTRLLRAVALLAPPVHAALATSAMRTLALGRPAPSTDGNLHAPVAEREAVHGWAARPRVPTEMDSLPTVSRYVAAPPEAVFRVLEDGWSYGSWVVGSARIRAVPPTWPRPGTRLHHSVGVWPVMLSDHTEALAYEPPHRLVLRAKGRPLGEATVEIVVTAEGAGSRVRIGEDVASSGLRALVPGSMRAALIRARNVETLRRLAMLAERATSPSGEGALGGDQASAQEPSAPAVTE